MINHPRNERTSEKKQEQGILVAATIPYPPIEVAGKNRNYAAILSRDMASSQGEITAITQYLWNSWRWESGYSEMVEVFREIAMVEMHHLDILGKLIILLGGNPAFRAVFPRQQIAWNGTMVQQGQTIQTALRENLRSEQIAADNYRKHAMVIQDSLVSDMLLRLALDEDIHIKILEGYLEQF